MVLESAISEITKHNIDFLEMPHPQFHDMPICPFAKKARIDEQIQYEVYDPDDVLTQIEVWQTTGKQVLVLVILDKYMSLADYMVHLESIKVILPTDLAVFEGHPQSPFLYNHVLTRQDPFPNFQFNKLSDLKEAEDQLHHSGWYEKEISMNGISRSTALTIKYGEISTRVVGPVNGKYHWEIDFLKNGEPHICPLLECSPHYDTSKAAEFAMNEVIKTIRESDS